MPTTSSGPWYDLRPGRPERVTPPRRTGTGQVVVFDNGKVSGAYEQWAGLPAIFRDAVAPGFDTVHTEAGDLLAESVPDLQARADDWRDRGVDAVVLLLCDAGVTTATIVQAALAAAHGIRVVAVGTPDVSGLMGVVTEAQQVAVPTLLIHADASSAPDEVAAAVRAQVPVLERLLEGSEDSPTSDATIATWRDGDLLRSDSFEDFETSTFLGDGLPLSAPTSAVVDALVEANGLDPDEILIPVLWPSNASISVRDCAVAAAMTRVPAAAFPVVTAAVRAVGHERYRLQTALTTTHSGGHLVLVTGPIAEKAGISSGRGCLGPGNPVNLAIGRAVNLALQTRSGAVPVHVNLSLLGSPGQVSMCFADRAVPGLATLNTTLGDPDASFVAVQKCESPHNLMDHVSSSALSIADSVAYAAISPTANNAYITSTLTVVLNPFHAGLLAREGWTRRSLGEHVFERARNPRATLAGRGGAPIRPAAWGDDLDPVPVVADPDDVILAVAGAPGPQSLLATPWGYSQTCVAQVPDGGGAHAPAFRWPTGGLR